MDPKARALDRAILSMIRRHSRAEAMSDPEFNALALRVFSFQFDHNPFYRRFCQIEHSSPANVRHWKEIPAMPAIAFKELMLATFPARKAVRRFRTSGTTAGARGVHFFETLELYRAAIAPPFRRFLLPDRQRMPLYFLTASPFELPDSSLSYMMGEVQKLFGVAGAGRYYVKKGKVLADRLSRDLAAAKKPVMILATAFSLTAFLGELGRRKTALKLPPGSRLMETGGFKGRAKEVSKKTLYRECARRLGIPAPFCVSEYGMTELSSQFYDTTLSDHLAGKKRRYFKIGPAWMRTVVVDPATGREAKKGRPGFLRHYDLANRGSVMAVQTEDLGRVVDRGFEVFGRSPGAGSRGCSLTYEALIRG